MKIKKRRDLVKCPKCKHEFLTRSVTILVNCNGCGGKFKRLENTVRAKHQKELKDD